MDIAEKIKQLPSKSGVYIMKGIKGKVLYVGKATSLRSRVRSHFSKSSAHSAAFTERVKDIECILCDTPEQALLVEAALIKERKPRYNVALRDDKSYPYVGITKEKYPRIFPIRPKKKPAMTLVGPFTNVALLRSVLKLIRKVFPYRSCRMMPLKPCLYYHIGLCPAPCKGGISAAAYKETVKRIVQILAGRKKALVKDLTQSMKECTRQMRYEEAARIRDTLVAIEKLYSGKESRSEMIILKQRLNLLRVPFRIEAIDISSLFGDSATGSVVVFINGMPDKDGYRRYKIKAVGGIDDYRMIQEIVLRRYRRLKEEQASLPDLVVIDGGLAHVNAADEILKQLSLSIAVIGIAKKNEEIWLPARNVPVRIERDNPGLWLIQRVRDEAHRFARKYHIVRRKKKFLPRRKKNRRRTKGT